MIEQDIDSQLMAVAAHRYCLGRRTYIVGSCIDWLTRNWGDIEPGHQAGIIRDTKSAIAADMAGDEMDKRAWAQFVREHEHKFSNQDSDQNVKTPE